MAVILMTSDIMYNYISIRYMNGGLQGIAAAFSSGIGSTTTMISSYHIDSLFNVRNIWLCYPIGHALAALTSFLIHRYRRNAQIDITEKQSI